jgi:hypothetical protein
MHLIPDRLHGPGNDPDNIVPAHNDVNSPARVTEQAAIAALRDPANEDKALQYTTTVTYHAAPMEFFPNRIVIHWALCTIDANARLTPTTTVGDWDSQVINAPGTATATGPGGEHLLPLTQASGSEMELIFPTAAGRRLKNAYAREFLTYLPYDLAKLTQVYRILATRGGNTRGYSDNTAQNDITELLLKRNRTVTLNSITYLITEQ